MERPEMRADRMQLLTDRLRSTSTRTFAVWPTVAIAIRLASGRPLQRRYLPLLGWGYGQYRSAGHYRTRVGGGGPGMGVPPERLVTTGIYQYTRNPMYMGHLVFLAGLALATGSPLLGAVFGWHLPWFDRRAQQDELQLESEFGDEYRVYRDRVPRWLPPLPTPGAELTSDRGGARSASSGRRPPSDGSR
jgi:hypothetical protein